MQVGENRIRHTPISTGGFWTRWIGFSRLLQFRGPGRAKGGVWAAASGFSAARKCGPPPNFAQRSLLGMRWRPPADQQIFGDVLPPPRFCFLPQLRSKRWLLVSGFGAVRFSGHSHWMSMLVPQRHCGGDLCVGSSPSLLAPRHLMAAAQRIWVGGLAPRSLQLMFSSCGAFGIMQ